MGFQKYNYFMCTNNLTTTDNGASTGERSPIKKGQGVTEAENYLGVLCDRTFLSLWSYPGVHRPNPSGNKEICDLLVVFQNHIIIFSDKDCVFPDSGNLSLDWNRWYRRAIKKAADQLWGAESWIKENPSKLYLDGECKQSFPIELPDPSKAIFHRVVVAHSGAERCRKEMEGGSGSLMIVSDIIGDKHYTGVPNNGKPFRVGQIDPAKGFVHVFDDTSLGIVLETLDTVSDFTAYLTKKERFLSKYAVCAAGEEELLAFYLKRMSEVGEHDFVVDGDCVCIAIEEGVWAEFQSNPQRIAQIREDEISYIWDALIEKSNYHILSDTQYYTSSPGVNNSERIMRVMAAENRLRRRVLSSAILGLISKPLPKDCRSVRVVKPDRPGLPFYGFLLLPHPNYITYEEYREARYKFLEAFCLVIKLQYPEAEDIVGIATEPRDSIERSEDTLYLDAREWTDSMQKEAAELQQKFGLLTNAKASHGTVQEYPTIESRKCAPAMHTKMKGSDRNAQCPCGSGKKYKRCCGLN